MKATKWIDKFKMGVVDGEVIYLSAPNWSCDWYWGFGYLGNKNCHYHLDSLCDSSINMYDGLKKHFGDTLTITDSKLWVFCELVCTAYALKNTAEVLGRGGSHYTTNPCADVIKNKGEADRINTTVLPKIFDAIHDLIIGDKK